MPGNLVCNNFLSTLQWDTDDGEWEDLGERFGLEVVDSDLDLGYSQSTKRKRYGDSEKCRKRKRIVISDSSESENENDKCDTHTDSDSGVNKNREKESSKETENDSQSTKRKRYGDSEKCRKRKRIVISDSSESENENDKCDTHTDSDSGVNKNREKESSKETENDCEISEKDIGPNETDSDSYGYQSENDSYEKESAGKTDSDSCEETSHRETDSVDTESEGNQVDIDKLKPKTIHSGRKITYKCPVCNFKCQSSGRVYGHMVNEHGAKKFRCEKCDFSTPNKTSLLNHVRCYCKNRGLKPKTFLTKRIVPKRKVKNPKQKLVRNEFWFFCQYCDYFGKSSGIVFGHMCEKHGIEPFKCSKCKFSTGNKTSFYNHITRYCR